jgi:hypothetical protein
MSPEDRPLLQGSPLFISRKMIDACPRRGTLMITENQSGLEIGLFSQVICINMGLSWNG